MSRIVFLRRSIIILLLILAFTSSVVSADVIPLAVPGIPTNVQASLGTYTNKIRVTWNAVAGATRYEVWRRVSGGSFVRLSPFPTTNLFDDTSADWHLFEYVVAACNGEGCSATSYPPVPGYLAVGTPSNVQASDGLYTDKIRVTWGAAANAIGYTIYRGTSSAGYSWSAPLGNVLEYEDTDVLTGALYYYWVRGCNGNDCSDFSADETGFRRLAEPQNLTTYDGIYCDRNYIYWSAVPGATYYKVRRGNNVGTYDTEWTNITEHSYNDYTAAASTIYYYSAVACNTNGCGSGSDSDPGYRGVPPAPSGIMATDGAYADRVNIHWTSVLGGQEYRLQRGLAPSFMDTTFPITVATSFNDYTALPGVIYHYRVSVSDNCGWSSHSPADAGYRPSSTPTHTPGPSPTPTSTPTAGPSPTSYGVWLPLLLKGDIGG